MILGLLIFLFRRCRVAAPVHKVGVGLMEGGEAPREEVLRLPGCLRKRDPPGGPEHTRPTAAERNWW